MGHIERGEKNVSFSTLVRLSDALGISVSELLSEERNSSIKVVSKSRKNQPTDLPSIVRQLNEQRQSLEETAGALKNVTNALRIHGRQSGKSKRFKK